MRVLVYDQKFNQTINNVQHYNFSNIKEFLDENEGVALGWALLAKGGPPRNNRSTPKVLRDHPPGDSPKL